MEKLIKNLVVASFILLLLLFKVAYSQAETNPIKIVDITYSEIEEGVKVEIKATNKIVYSVMRLTEPDRIVVDIKNAILVFERKIININIGAITKVRYAQFQVEPLPIVRIVVDLTQPLPYTIELSKDEKKLYIFLKQITEIIDMNYEIKEDVIIVRAIGTNKLKFIHFKLPHPPRIVVDLENTFLSKSAFKLKVNFFQIVNLRIVQLKGEPKPVVRIVADLKEMVMYDTYKSKDEKIVYLKIYPILPYMKDKIIVIDAGHGGYDPGAISPYSNMYEKDVTLSIAKHTYKILKLKGCKVFMTRSTDKYLSLGKRVTKTKNINPDIFISIHLNGMVNNTQIRGIETYYYNANSEELAKVIHNNLVKETSLPCNGIKTAAFMVIKNLDIPAILLEIGYITNEEDEKLLRDTNFHITCARGIYKGILQYFKSIYNISSSEVSSK